jgi:hypothetical protein
LGARAAIKRATRKLPPRAEIALRMMFMVPPGCELSFAFCEILRREYALATAGPLD